MPTDVRPLTHLWPLEVKQRELRCGGPIGHGHQSISPQHLVLRLHDDSEMEEEICHGHNQRKQQDMGRGHRVLTNTHMAVGPTHAKHCSLQPPSMGLDWVHLPIVSANQKDISICTPDSSANYKDNNRLFAHFLPTLCYRSCVHWNLHARLQLFSGCGAGKRSCDMILQLYYFQIIYKLPCVYFYWSLLWL